MIVSAAATLHNSRTLWYLTRGTGLVAVVLLTLGVVLGVVTSLRVSAPGWPRFLLADLHRNLSYLVFGVLVIHIGTAVLDTFAPIGLWDVVLPLHSSYRPVWLGLGALSFDLLLAVLVTSLLRVAVGYRKWRALHWAVYPAWAAAIVHGLGTGSDTKVSWAFAITALCVVAVLAAVGWRLTVGWPQQQPLRLAAGGATALGVVLLAGWVRSGPLHTGWARAAGTPPSLLSAAARARAATPASSGSSGLAGAAPPAVDRPFSGSVQGRLTQAAVGNGLVRVTLRLSAGGTVPGQLVIVIDGEPSAGGGVAETASRVTFSPTGTTDRFSGALTTLDGNQLAANVSDGRTAVTLQVAISIDGSGGVTGSLNGSPA